MKITFYKTESESNRVDKVLNEPLEIEGSFRSDVDVINPTLSLSTDITQYNYCLIPSLNRYYFVNTIEITRTGMITVSLSLDVLMTYNEQIKDLYVIVSKAGNANPYNNSNSPAVDVRTDVERIDFNNAFNELGSIVMVTI